MPRVPYNSVGGYSTGLTMTTVIDSLGNITGVGATFSGLILANAGISASGGITFNNLINVNGAKFGLTGSANYLYGNINTGGLLTTGSKNVLIGTDSGSGLTNQTDNVAIGDSALKNSSYTRCVAIGSSALLNNTKNDIVAIGSRAGQSNTGLYVVALGSDAALSNTADTVLAIGYNACANNAGAGNMGIGPFALCNNTSSSANQNCALGNNALFANSGANNVSVGNNTLVGGVAYVGQSGSRNAVIGYYAGFNNTSGSDNVFIGNQAGFGNSSGSNNVFIGSGACGSTSGTTTREIVIGSNAVGLGSNTTVIGATSATSATIYGLLNVPSGISAAGGTFSGNIRLQNSEYLQNTTNGRVDIMPAPTGSTQFGMYFDMTSWGYGAQIGTIRSSDGALNSGGNILWNVPLIVGTDVNFAFGTDSQFRIGRTSTGLDTLQSGLYCDGVNNSGAFALVALSDQGLNSRSPATAHTTPNFYIYANSTIRNNANDFIRFEHDTINGRIVSGGTSGISIEPGSGVVGISGGISASGMVVLAQGVCGGYGNDVQSYGYTSGYDIIPTNWQSISANIAASPDINSIYLAPINISKKSIIKSIATQRGTDTTGNTGNFYLGLYNSNLYGLPNTLVYSSPSTVLGTGNFGVNRVSNVNYTANPGTYWIGIIFSAAGLSAGLARYGGTSTKLVSPISSSPVAQTTVTGLTAATSGFTLPTNLNNVSVTNVLGNNFPAVFFTAEGAT